MSEQALGGTSLWPTLAFGGVEIYDRFRLWIHRPFYQKAWRTAVGPLLRIEIRRSGPSCTSVDGQERSFNNVDQLGCCRSQSHLVKVGDEARRGSMHERSQVFVPKPQTWTTENTNLGRLREQKQDGTPLKIVRKEHK